MSSATIGRVLTGLAVALGFGAILVVLSGFGANLPFLGGGEGFKRAPIGLPNPAGAVGSRQFDPRLPRDAIRPIYEPTFVSVAEADLDAGELVMGLMINGDVRAYPVTPLRRREMVNDVVGGTPVLVTW